MNIIDRYLMNLCFKQAKKKLENGKENHICIAIYHSINFSYIKRKCIRVIDRGINHKMTMEDWMYKQRILHRLNIDGERMFYEIVPMARIAWLDKLIFDYENRSR